MDYIGEHLWVGQLGHALIVLAFVAALLSAIGYGFGVNAKSPELQKSWQNIGRTSFWIHGGSIFAIIGLIFFMMLQRYYEYEYVWGHVSDELPFKYIFSAFWEGQEGSFLLWMFWHVVLGMILMFTAKNWEMPVLSTLSIVQVFLSSMILGLYFGAGDSRFGSSPFALLRDVHEAPIFNTENYLQSIKGTGLNPLLQNYWMTIHPPTLFLGFASTIVPFAYAIAGLWKGEHRTWMKPALAWALFSGAILGTGILMGGAWAYEALSFGGYWAWDPVENASLVPWIIMVAGIHTALTAKNSGHSIRSTYIFFILSFVLIVYSTFLTRSGVLGETSVHAFTEMGLEWQLIIFLLVITIWPFLMFFVKGRNIPKEKKEESAYSREFWMFVGALVLLFSSVLITATTSIPVWNKITDGVSWLFGGGDVPNIAPPEDEISHHNRFQLWIGVLIGLLSGISVMMRYKVEQMTESYRKFLLRHLGVALLGASLITIPIMWWSGIVAWQYWLLVWSGIFTIISNLDYIITVIRGKIKVAAAPVAHIGFGLLMVGVVFSGALKRPISDGFNSVDMGDLNPQNKKNVLVAKGAPIPIADGYEVQYVKDWSEGNLQYFELKFTRKDASGKVVESFTTQPNVIRDVLPDGSFKFRAANPNTRRYLSRDIFTLAVPHWAFDAPEEKKKKKDEPVLTTDTLEIGDTLYTRGHVIVFKGLGTDKATDSLQSIQNITIKANLAVGTSIPGEIKEISPSLVISGNAQESIPAEIREWKMMVQLYQLIPLGEQKAKVVFNVWEIPTEGEYVVMQAIIFPGINWVWLGSIMMMLGLLMGMWNKRK